MATSKIKIYQTEIVPSKNAKIDDIEAYLEQFQPTYESENFQYQQIGLNIEVKIPVDQSYVGRPIGNYVNIEQDGRHYYFFIMGAGWRAKKCISLTLSLDTLNTFWDDLDWNAKTSIIRQHADRFYPTPIGTYTYLNAIDRFNEGLNPNLDNQKAYDAIYDRDTPEVNNWYLVYKSSDNLNPSNFSDPISMMVLADRELPISEDVHEPVITTDLLTWVQSHMTTGQWYQQHIYITSSGLENASVRINDGVNDYTLVLDQAGQNNDFIRMIHIFAETPTAWVAEVYYYTGDTYPYSYNGKVRVSVFNNTYCDITFNNIKSAFLEYGTHYVFNTTSLPYIDSNQRITLDSGDIPGQRTIAFEDFQRNGGTLSRIIQLPYAPANITKDIHGQYYIFPNGWHYNPGYKGMEAPLRDDWLRKTVADFNLSDYLETRVHGQPQLTDVYAGKDYEPKLKSSEFTNIALTYDSLTIPLKLERFRKVGSSSPNFDFPLFFQVSNAMSSELLLSTGRNTTFFYDKDKLYDLTAVSTRNLEKPIFNSGYVDYLRNGYNYDQETTKRQNKVAVTNAVIGGIQGAVQFGGSLLNQGIGIGTQIAGYKEKITDLFNRAAGSMKDSASQNPGISITIDGGDSAFGVVPEERKTAFARIRKGYELDKMQAMSAAKTGIAKQFTALSTMVMSQGIGAFSSVINVGNTIAGNNAASAHTLQQQQNSTANVSVSSGVDLMESYMESNKVHLSVFSLRDEELDNIAKLFYYVGYSHPKQEIPNTTSRSWFNFLQCKAEFNNEQTSVYSNYVDDIKARLEIGVTVYHKNVIDGDDVWDINQTKENWETALIQ